MCVFLGWGYTLFYRSFSIFSTLFGLAESHRGLVRLLRVSDSYCCRNSYMLFSENKRPSLTTKADIYVC